MDRLQLAGHCLRPRHARRSLAPRCEGILPDSGRRRGGAGAQTSLADRPTNCSLTLCRPAGRMPAGAGGTPTLPEANTLRRRVFTYPQPQLCNSGVASRWVAQASRVFRRASRPAVPLGARSIRLVSATRWATTRRDAEPNRRDARTTPRGHAPTLSLRLRSFVTRTNLPEMRCNRILDRFVCYLREWR
jgi:hypothetical protein